MVKLIKNLLFGKPNPKGTTLKDLIPPEIVNDAFYKTIVHQAASESVSSILEIGSSAGGGSTRAFVEGILQNPRHPNLYCMEVSQERFQALQAAYSAYDFVHAFNYSSVPLKDFATPEMVEEFYRTHPTKLNQYPLETVLSWLQADLDYVASNGKDMEGIRLIKESEHLDFFDLVLIDGSEFTGVAEFNEIIGAGVILLDDINAYKNHENYYTLKENPHYQILEENWSLRNGYAIFKKIN